MIQKFETSYAKLCLDKVSLIPKEVESKPLLDKADETEVETTEAIS
jgi:hypothetical protein